jgi:putative flippase GtrA
VRSGAFSSTTFCAEARRLARYFAVGGAAAAVDISLFMLFAGWLGFPYLRVTVCTFLVATLVNYVLSVRFVFVSGERFTRGREIVLVYAVSALGLALHAAILWLAFERLGFPLLAAKLAATGTVFFWNYVARRLFVFGTARP